jgi:hypothetical protein
MEKIMNEFHLNIKLVKPKVIQLDMNCSIEMRLLEKAFEHMIRHDPKLKEMIGRALMHSMTPKSDDTFVIYDSNSN